MKKRFYSIIILTTVLAALVYCQQTSNEKQISSNSDESDSFQKNNSKEIIFLSDMQNYFKMETIALNPYRNEEATDSLTSNISRRKVSSIFLLGDLLADGTDGNDWERVEKYLAKLNHSTSNIFAIPGNHEVMKVKNPFKDPMKTFKAHFPNSPTDGFVRIVDSIAIIMLNSNECDSKDQKEFYKTTFEKLESDNSVKFIIVATHYPPYTNSKIVEASEDVQKEFVPLFLKSPKAKLFLSGHSHNLEYFIKDRKNFLVLGGGGGLKQPLKDMKDRKWKDMLEDDSKPLYFYVSVKRIRDTLEVNAIGFKKDFIFHTFPVMKIIK